MRSIALSLLLFLLPCIAGQAESVSLATLNCYWFGADDFEKTAVEPITKVEYSQKAGHLIGLLPQEAPLFIGLQEIGTSTDADYLAHSAKMRWKREYQTLFVQGNDTATRQDVAALLDTSRGWGVHGRPSRPSELQKELSKHLVVRLTNASTHLDICVVHLRVPRDKASLEQQRDQNRALLRWSMRHLAKNPTAHVVIMGDFNEGKPVGSPDQSLAALFQAKPPMVDSFSLLTGKTRTHQGGGAYDRILVSEAIATGTGGMKLEAVRVIDHRHGREDRRLYTDHFPVVVTLRVEPGRLLK
ncbi:MAG: hypothetical protein AB9869_31675 [Verrucomicrobiia bacterium]